MSTPVDVKRMRYVLEVARAEAITTAAETLGVTQSALSRSIAEVEASLGLPLFHRLPRGIRLTEAGERFVNGARRVLHDIDNLLNHVREPRELMGGRFRVGFAPSGYVDHGARALRDFARHHPEVGIDVVTGSTQSLCARLMNGEFDALVGSSVYLARWREIEVHPISKMNQACMVRRDHPLAQQPAPTELDALRYPFVLPRSVEPGFSVVGERFAAHGLPPFVPRYVVDDFNVILRIVRNTDAVYVVMSPYSDFNGLAEHAALLENVLDLEPHYIAIAYASHRPRSAAAERYEELLREHLAKVH